VGPVVVIAPRDGWWNHGSGHYLTRGGTNPMHLARGTGRVRGAGWISRVDATGSSLGHVLKFDDSESLLVQAAGRAVSMAVPFGGRMFVTLTGDAFVLGYSDAYELQYHSPPGQLLRIVRKQATPVPVAAGEVDAYRSDYPGRRSDRPEAAELARALVFPAHLSVVRVASG
jgi:hypothetical protein